MLKNSYNLNNSIPSINKTSNSNSNSNQIHSLNHHINLNLNLNHSIFNQNSKINHQNINSFQSSTASSYSSPSSSNFILSSNQNKIKSNLNDFHFDQGQFSDAELDYQSFQLPKSKRLKKNSLKLNQIDSSSSNLNKNLKISSNLNSSSRNSIQKNLISSSTKHFKNLSNSSIDITNIHPNPLKSNHLINSSSSSKLKSNSKTLANQNLSQLPMATRKLAILVGIPESSQAIIQSTLSLPSKNLNHQNNLISKQNSENIPTNFQSIPSSQSFEKLIHSNPNSSQISNKISKSPIINKSLLVSKPLSSSKDSTIIQKIPLIELKHKDQNLIHNSIPPSYRRSQNSSDQYDIPSPGTFSIPAPSVQIFNSLDHSSLSSNSNQNQSQSQSQSQSQNQSQSQSQISNPSSQNQNHHSQSLNPSSQNQNHHSQISNPSSQNQNHHSQSLNLSNSSSINLKKSKQNQNHQSLDNLQPEIKLVKPPPTINGKISHGRKVPPGYVKRTPNSFLMFRSHVISNKLLPPGVENDNRQISRIVSGLWAGLSEEDLNTWRNASRELRAAARAKNPDLKHTPNQKRRQVIRRKRNGQLPGETPEQRVQREKATAAALAKVIIDARGQKLDKDKLVELAQLSLSTAFNPSNSINHSKSLINHQSQNLNSSNNLLHLNNLSSKSSSSKSSSIAPELTCCSDYDESTITTSPLELLNPSSSSLIHPSNLNPTIHLENLHSNSKKSIPSHPLLNSNQQNQSKTSIQFFNLDHHLLSPQTSNSISSHQSPSTLNSSNNLAQISNEPINNNTMSLSNQILHSLGLSSNTNLDLNLNLNQPSNLTLSKIHHNHLNPSFSSQEIIQNQSTSKNLTLENPIQKISQTSSNTQIFHSNLDQSDSLNSSNNNLQFDPYMTDDISNLLNSNLLDFQSNFNFDNLNFSQISNSPSTPQTLIEDQSNHQWNWPEI